MKKFFIVLFSGLMAVFGSIVSVGSKSSFNNFNEFKTVQNAIVFSDDDVTIILDGSITYNNNLRNPFSILSIITSDNLENNFFGYYQDGNLYYLDTFTVGLSPSTQYNLTFGANDLDYFDAVIGFRFTDGNGNYIDTFSITRDEGTNSYDLRNVDNVIYDIDAFVIFNYEDYYIESDSLDSYIGNLIIIPDLPITPSPPSQNFLDDITSTINGVIDWFVDLFNGLADIFVIYDSNGSFAGFSLWGNVLFIEVSIMLVVIVLRWVISLIRGI